MDELIDELNGSNYYIKLIFLIQFVIKISNHLKFPMHYKTYFKNSFKFLLTFTKLIIKKLNFNFFPNNITKLILKNYIFLTIQLFFTFSRLPIQSKLFATFLINLLSYLSIINTVLSQFPFLSHLKKKKVVEFNSREQILVEFSVV